MARKAISKKLRFEIFKRDGFMCHYCGAHPPSATLHVDHIVPVASGGRNDLGNLITACSFCNQGKGARDLGSETRNISLRIETYPEQEMYIKKHSPHIQDTMRRENEAIHILETAFIEHFGEIYFSHSYREAIRRNFLRENTHKFSIHEMWDNMFLACDDCTKPEDATINFNAICWGELHEKDLLAGA